MSSAILVVVGAEIDAMMPRVLLLHFKYYQHECEARNVLCLPNAPLRESSKLHPQDAQCRYVP